jgi:hypothetical protein
MFSRAAKKGQQTFRLDMGSTPPELPRAFPEHADSSSVSSLVAKVSSPSTRRPAPGDLGAPLVGRTLLYWWPDDGWQRGTVA